MSEDNRDRLAKFGTATDTMDDCLEVVLKIAEAKRETPLGFA